MQFKKYLTTLLFLALSLQGLKAQDIYKVKALFYSFSLREFPYVHSDSVIVTKKSNDTTWFNTTVSYPSGQGFYYRAGQKVYKKEGAKDLLLYDYGLIQGNTFILRTNDNVVDEFMVDSVYSKKLNHRTFKAWHLTEKVSTGARKMEWIEGLGELGVGWDTKHYTFTDGGWFLKGMCLNDSVIYWDSTYKYFKDREPAPTCMIDSVSKRLSLERLVSNPISLYPNPASDVLNLNTKSSGTFSILDQNGKICIKDQPFDAGNHIINTSVLEPGIYCIAILSGSELLYRKICILKP